MEEDEEQGEERGQGPGLRNPVLERVDRDFEVEYDSDEEQKPERMSGVQVQQHQQTEETVLDRAWRARRTGALSLSLSLLSFLSLSLYP